MGWSIEITTKRKIDFNTKEILLSIIKGYNINPFQWQNDKKINISGAWYSSREGQKCGENIIDILIDKGYRVKWRSCDIPCHLDSNPKLNRSHYFVWENYKIMQEAL